MAAAQCTVLGSPEPGRGNGNHVRQRTALYLSGDKQPRRHGHLALDHVKGALNFNGSKG